MTEFKQAVVACLALLAGGLISFIVFYFISRQQRKKEEEQWQQINQVRDRAEQRADAIKPVSEEEALARIANRNVVIDIKRGKHGPS